MLKKFNATGSKILSKITGREIADEERMPTVHVMLHARDLR